MDPIARTTLSRLFSLLAVLAPACQASAATRYLTVINDDQRAIVRVEVAEAGTGRFSPLNLPSPLIGGREGQAVAAMPAGPCRRDLRVVYRDASTLTVNGWDSCRQSVLHVGTAYRAAFTH